MPLLNDPNTPFLVFLSCQCLTLVPFCIVFAFKLYRKLTVFNVFFLGGLVFTFVSSVLNSSTLVDKPRDIREQLMKGAICFQTSGALLISLAFIIRFNSHVPILSDMLITTASPNFKRLIRKFIKLLPYCFASLAILLFIYFIAAFALVWSVNGLLETSSLVILVGFIALIDFFCSITFIYLLFKQKTTINTGSHSLKKDKITMLSVLFIEILFLTAGTAIGFLSKDGLDTNAILSHSCFICYVIPCSVFLILFRNGADEEVSSQGKGQSQSSLDSNVRKMPRLATIGNAGN
jgi:hypothetical protein